MKEYKDILTKKELFVNLLFYICRYSLYLIAFCCLFIIIGELFCIILFCFFCIITRLHIENDIKIQKAVVASEISKYTLDYKGNKKNCNTNNKDEVEK